MALKPEFWTKLYRLNLLCFRCLDYFSCLVLAVDNPLPCLVGLTEPTVFLGVVNIKDFERKLLLGVVKLVAREVKFESLTFS